MTPWQKPSVLLAFASWVSVFALAWLLILGKLQCSALTSGALAFFFVIAVAASAIASPSKKEDDDEIHG